MKILQLTYDLGSGGIETFVTNLNSCRSVFEEPFDFLLFSGDDFNGFYEEVNRAMGSHIYKIGNKCSRFFLFRSIQKRYRVYKFLKDNKYDVVHIHNSNVFCITEAISAKLAGVDKVIVHSHNTKLGSKGWKKFIKKIVQISMKWLWPYVADEYCACSTEAGIWMFGKHPKRKVKILKNGIVAKDFYFNEKIRDMYREKLGWQNCHIIGHVGRFSKQKNHDFLVDIFSEVCIIDSKARLLLIGDGELISEIKEKVKVLGIEDKVIFYGTSKEVNCLLQAMDLFLFPSLYEGLPVSGIEAQAAGLPILASDTISPELKVTPNLHWMSLQSNALQWAKSCVEILGQHVDRNISDNIINQGYDIESTAKELYNIMNKNEKVI